MNNGLRHFLGRLLFLLLSGVVLYAAISADQMKKYYGQVYKDAKSYYDSVKKLPDTNKEKQFAVKMIQALQKDGKKIQSLAATEKSAATQKEYKDIAARLKKINEMVKKAVKASKQNQKKPSSDQIQKQIDDYQKKISALQAELDKLAAGNKPPVAADPLGEIKKLLARNLYSQAAEQLEKMIISDPGNTELHFMLAQTEFSAEHYASAYRAIREALRLSGRNDNYWQLAGEISLALDDKAMAYSAFTEAVKINLMNWDARIGIASLLLAEGYADSAEHIYKEAEKLGILPKQVNMGLGMVAEKHKNWESAKMYYQKAISSGQNDTEVYRRLGKIYLAENQTDYAIRYFDGALKQNPGDLNTRFLEGMAYFRGEQYSRAIAEWQKVYDADNRYKDIIFWLPVVLFVQAELEAGQNLYGESTRHYQEALKINPESYYWLSYGNYWMGDIARRGRHFDKAEVYFNKALELNPVLPDAYFGMGRMRWDQQRFSEAATYWEKTLQLDPAHTEANAWLPLAKNRLNE